MCFVFLYIFDFTRDTALVEVGAFKLMCVHVHVHELRVIHTLQFDTAILVYYLRILLQVCRTEPTNARASKVSRFDPKKKRYDIIVLAISISYQNFWGECLIFMKSKFTNIRLKFCETLQQLQDAKFLVIFPIFFPVHTVFAFPDIIF